MAVAKTRRRCVAQEQEARAAQVPVPAAPTETAPGGEAPTDTAQYPHAVTHTLRHTAHEKTSPNASKIAFLQARYTCEEACLTCDV